MCNTNWRKQVFYETIEMSNKRFYYSFIFCITLHLFLHCLKAHYLQVRINISWPFFVLENCPLSLAINLTGAEGIYRKVVIVISVILSRPFGYGSMLLAERACFELGSHSPWHWRSIVSPSKISFGSTCYTSSKDEDMAKKDEIVMKCQLSVYLLRTLFECSGYKTIFSKTF